MDSDLSSLVHACIKSAKEFNENFDKIAVNIDNPSSVDSILTTIKTILVEDTKTPANKFYSLLLLTKLVERNSEAFMKNLSKSKEVLSTIFESAQRDGKKPLE